MNLDWKWLAPIIIDEEDLSLECRCWREVNQLVIAVKDCVSVCVPARLTHVADALVLKVSRHGEMGSLFGVSCRQSHPHRWRYMRSLDAHTWKGRSTCESSDLATLVTVEWVASLVCVADNRRPVDGGKGDLLPASTLTNSFWLCCMIVIIHICHTLWVSTNETLKLH